MFAVKGRLPCVRFGASIASTQPMGRAMKPVRVQVVATALLLLFSSACTCVTRASVDTNGGDLHSFSFNPSISADGRYVAFWSPAGNVVPGDANGVNDVFVRDMRTNTTIRASVDMNGGDPNGESFFPSISADGRYVAFASSASDLAPGDNGTTEDIYVRDLQMGTNTRATVDAAGEEPNAGTRHAWISGDGRHVVFASTASDLVVGDGNGLEDVFVRDLDAGATTRASVDASGGDSNGASGASSMFVPSAISADGRYVAFWSDASDLVPADGNRTGDIFLRDLQTDSTSRISVAGGGGDANGGSDFTCGVDGQSISADGRYVAFCSYASNLTGADENRTADVFVRDRQLGSTTRISGAFDGDPTGGSGTSPSISADGRYVAFFSGAPDLVPNDANDASDVFVRDRETGATILSSADFGGRPGNDASAVGQISADGRYVTFHSGAGNLVSSDGNGAFDIFVRAVITPTVDSVAPATVARGATATLLLTGSGFRPDARVYPQVFGPPGVHVNSVTVMSETAIEISVSVDAGAEPGTRNVMVWNPGTGPGDLATGYGFCFHCLGIV